MTTPPPSTPVAEQPKAPQRHHVQYAGDYSAMIYKAVCSCGWETLQRDLAWAEEHAHRHLDAVASAAEDSASTAQERER